MEQWAWEERVEFLTTVVERRSRKETGWTLGPSYPGVVLIQYRHGRRAGARSMEVRVAL